MLYINKATEKTALLLREHVKQLHFFGFVRYIFPPDLFLIDYPTS